MVAEAIDLTLGRHVVALAKREWGQRCLEPIGPHLSALMPLEPACDMQRRWHVVQTEPQQEMKVASLLRSAKMDAYHPQQPKSVRVNAVRRRTVMRPMLVGYVFAGFDIRFDPWEVIHDMRGVLRLFEVKERPLPVPESDIDHIRNKEAEMSLGKAKQAPIYHKIGDLVQLTEDAGSWSGFFGRVLYILAPKDRIGIGIDLFGRQTPVEVSVNQVRAV